MAQGLLAAYNTVQSDFYIHHLTTQFFYPGIRETPITFEVMRTSDKKNSAARIVFVFQRGVRINMMTMDFIRRPIIDGLSLRYHAQFPEGIALPDDEVDDLKFFGNGLMHGQSLGRRISEYLYHSVHGVDNLLTRSGPESRKMEDNTTLQWLKSGSISSNIGERLHHAGLAFLTDQYILDTPARLHNLQLGLGEPKVGACQEDSPYDKRSTRDKLNMTDFRMSPPSDLRVMTTLNHAVHFYNPELTKADEWVLMEANTSFAYGGRVLIHSKLFSQDGTLLAVCTQEVGWYSLSIKSENNMFHRAIIG